MQLRMANAEYDGILAGIRKSTPAGSVVVIKYGGHAMENEEAKKQFCEDIGALCRTGVLPVIVHGGGPQIAKMLANLKIESRFENGLRVTDAATMEVAQMVLCGSINKEIVGKISGQEGVRGAVGLCGLDSQLIKAKVKNPTLGLVGEPSTVNTDIIKDLLALKLVPVIAPVGCNEKDGTALNINADTAAGAVAEALKADRLLLLTDIVGVLDKEKKLIETIPSTGPTSLKALTADGTITGGMIPKLETGVQAVEAGVKVVSIMDGRVKFCILRALSGEVFGTRIVK
jgi:acetylglutamate kinase